MTDSSGHFAVEDLAEGRYLLTASGYAPVTAQVTVARDRRQDVELVVEPPQPMPSAPVADLLTGLESETTPLPVVG